MCSINVCLTLHLLFSIAVPGDNGTTSTCGHAFHLAAPRQGCTSLLSLLLLPLFTSHPSGQATSFGASPPRQPLHVGTQNPRTLSHPTCSFRRVHLLQRTPRSPSLPPAPDPALTLCFQGQSYILPLQTSPFSILPRSRWAAYPTCHPKTSVI